MARHVCVFPDFDCERNQVKAQDKVITTGSKNMHAQFFHRATFHLYDASRRKNVQGD